MGLTPFLLAAWAEGHTAPSILLRWFTTHPEADWGPVRPSTQILRAMAGLARLLFPVSGGETWIKALLAGRHVDVNAVDVLTLARNVIGLVLLGALTIRGAWRNRRTLAGAVLFPSCVLMAIFCSTWFGSDPQFWLPALPLLVGLAVLGWPGGPTWISAPAVAFAMVTLLAVNVSTEAPSLLRPRGGPEWRATARAAELLGDGTLVVGPSTRAVNWLSALRSDVQWLNLTYGLSGLRGADYIERVRARIAEAHARNRPVVFIGLMAPIRPELLGPWELTEHRHAASRDMLRDMINTAFERRPAARLGREFDVVCPKPPAETSCPTPGD